MAAINIADNLLNVFIESISEMSNISRKIDSCEDEIRDILHVLEGSNFSASDGYRLAKRIKELRIDRRELLKERKVLHLLVESITGKRLQEVKDLKGRMIRESERLNAQTIKDYSPKVYRKATVKSIVDNVRR